MMQILSVDEFYEGDCIANFDMQSIHFCNLVASICILYVL